jgi:hypothetical protein
LRSRTVHSRLRCTALLSLGGQQSKLAKQFFRHLEWRPHDRSSLGREWKAVLHSWTLS